MILSMIFVGNKSIWMVFLSGSSPGISIPFSIDLVYLSPRPLTYTYFPSSTETPATLFTAAAALLSPAFLIVDADTPAIKFGEFLLIVAKATSVFLSCLATMTISSTTSESSLILTSITFTSPSVTSTLLTVKSAYPRYEKVKV